MDPAWGPNMQLIQNLGLRLNHTNGGGESAVISYVDEQMLQNKDFMAFVYSPHALIAKHGLVRVGLPEHRSDCFFGWELGVPDNTTVCDFPNEMPFKVASIDLHRYSNVSHAMTKQLFISPDDLVALATDVAEGSTYFESACSWIKANRDLVDDWVAASKAACGVGHYFSNRTLTHMKASLTLTTVWDASNKHTCRSTGNQHVKRYSPIGLCYSVHTTK